MYAPTILDESILYTYNLRSMPHGLLVEKVGPVSGQSILCLRGPMTMDNLSPFQNAIRNELASVVIIDLADVPYIDSGGLGSLVGAYITCHKAGRQVVLAGLNDQILKLFEITRVVSLFLMFPTVDEAIDAFTTPAQA